VKKKKNMKIRSPISFSFQQMKDIIHILNDACCWLMDPLSLEKYIMSKQSDFWDRFLGPLLECKRYISRCLLTYKNKISHCLLAYIYDFVCWWGMVLRRITLESSELQEANIYNNEDNIIICKVNKCLMKYYSPIFNYKLYMHSWQGFQVTCSV